MEPYDQIKHAIITGKLEQGKRLTEEALAEELHVSRTPIREALKQLELEGLVTPLKRGVIVRIFSNKDVIQIYNLRALLESYAASEAAMYRSKQELKKMKEANLYYEKAVQQYTSSHSQSLQSILDANAQFHDAILTATNNEHLRFHLSKVVVLPLVFHSFYWYNEQQLYRSYDIHETILSAITNQDSIRAKSAMQEHVFLARDHVLSHLDAIEDKLSEGMIR